MCGFIIHCGQEIIDELHPAITSIKHRGPDALCSRFFEKNNYRLSLAHARLTIIDLEHHADQPFSNEFQQHIVFNGEIYNYIELRQELIQRGYHFRTSSDTEVLLAAYHQWRERCLDKLRGMFSFAVFDEKEQKIFVARDRFGIKPLYYWMSGQEISFCSEIKQLIHLRTFTAKANREAVYQFLVHDNLCINEQTLFEGVREIEPGHYVTFDLNTKNHFFTQWYSIEDKIHLDKFSYTKDLQEEFEEKFRDALSLHLRADVPLATLLSGGVDSSALTYFSNRVSGQRIKSYSAGFNERKYDESSAINHFSKITGIENQLYRFGPESTFSALEDMIYHAETPLWGKASFAQFSLYKKIHEERLKVVLEGQGADEILAGYNMYFYPMLIKLLLAGHIKQSANEFNTYARLNNLSKITVFKRAMKALLGSEKPLPFRRNMKAKDHYFLGLSPTATSDLQRVSINLKKQYISRFKVLRSILHFVDRFSMAHSIESRVPFLDHELVEFSLQLPISMVMQQGFRKYPLRKYLDKQVPNIFFESGGKMGFNAPQAIWAKNHLKQEYLQRLSQAGDRLSFLDSKEIVEAFNNFTLGKHGYDTIFFKVLSLSSWANRFCIDV